MELSQIFSLIVEWYAENRKPLPWRISPTPYHVWVSEIMLQQTRIEAVIPYYARFLDALPTVKDLAEVDDDALMKLWEGLGYYSRVRNMKKAAGILVSQYGGELPHTAAELRTLPGIGDYTAGAIASIAFGEGEPAVDGNVLRVMSRIFAFDDDITLQKTKRDVTEKLRAAYPTGQNASLLTEGLMELGEVVCLPNGEPKCALCPVSAQCRAALTGTVADYPVKSAKKARRVEEKTVLLLSFGGKYAIRRRVEPGLLSGMWEFPNEDGTLSEPQVLEAVKQRCFTPVRIQPLPSARHIFTHIEWHMTGWLVEIEPVAEGPAQFDGIFVEGAEIRKTYAIPTAFRAYTEALPS